MEKFLNFLGTLKTEDNSSVLESIAHGYLACFENVEVPRLKLRLASSQEKEDYRAKNPHLPPENSAQLIVITSPDNKIITYASSPRDAEFLKANLEKRANRILNEPIPTVPPSVLLNDEKTSGMSPELQKIIDPESQDHKKQEFWLWKNHWDEYLNAIHDINKTRSKFMKQHDWAFKKYDDDDD